MSEGHEAVQELLAAYSLHSLDGEEREEAEALIATHLPACEECRLVFEDLQGVTAEMALATAARKPPRLMAARLRRDVRSSRRRRSVGVLATGLALAGVISLSLWTAHLSNRVNDADSRQAKTGEFLATLSHPLSHVISFSTLRPASDEEIGLIQLKAAFVPGHGSVYLFGSMPAPQSDRVYQVWVLRSGHFVSAGTFRPEKGQVIMQIQADPEHIDGLLVTEEPSQGSQSPSDQRVVTASF